MPNKGKTWEEIYGAEKAAQMREQFKKRKNNPRWKEWGKLGGQKIKKQRKGKKLEEIYGATRAEKIKKTLSQKAHEQLIREYATGKRDPREATRKAVESIRRNGQPKLKGRKPWNTGKKCPTLSAAKKGKGWCKGLTKETSPKVRRMAEKIKKYFAEHPEKNGAVIVSKRGRITKPQKELYKKVKEIFPQAELDKAISIDGKRIRVPDVLIADQQLVFEYDGSFWHNPEKDRERDMELMNQNLRVIHFVDFVPGKELILQTLEQPGQIIYVR